MKLPDNVFDILSWVGKIVLPALAVFIIAIEDALGFNIYADQISKIIMACDVLLNTLLGVASVNYYKDQNKEEIDSVVNEESVM